MKIDQFFEEAKNILRADGDIEAFTEFLKSHIDVWSDVASLGYAVAGAQAAGFTHKQIAKLIDAIDAAHENMTVSDAEKFYEEGNF